MGVVGSISASSSDRWMNCPGSVRLSADIPRHSSPYAQEGTNAHSLAEYCLRQHLDPEDLVGQTISPNRESFEVTEDMAEAVRVYVDYVRDLDKRCDFVKLEQSFDLSDQHPGLRGTTDCCAFSKAERTLYVVDYKHGQGVFVDADNNSQLMYYGMGALRSLVSQGLSGIDNIILVIVQPRSRSEGTKIREWQISPEDLLDWELDLVEAAKKTQVPDAPLVSGEHCKFCPAAGICPKKQEDAYETAMAEFNDIGDMKLPSVRVLGPDQLGALYHRVQELQDWASQFMKYALQEAEAGRCPEGLKLVPKRATRKWTDEEAVKNMLIQKGMDENKILTEPELLSVAQMEKLVKKTLGAQGPSLLEGWIEAVSSGYNLVPADDKRQGVTKSAEDDFAGL